METKENWISKEGYSLNISRLNQDVISGNLEIGLDGEDMLVPFEGLINHRFGNQFEFCFIVDWHSYVANGICYTSFVGKNYFKNDIEYIGLKWLLVYEINRPKLQNLSIQGKSKFIRVLKEINNQDLSRESNNLPCPFFIDMIKTKVGTEWHRH